MDGYTIRKATRGDLRRIRAWLKQEHRDGIEGSFWSNYDLIEKGQQSGSLTALIRDSDAMPVAFCLGSDNIEILEVKEDCRRNGFGRHLAQYFIDSAWRRDVIGLHGECAPQSSRPFWTAMGYVSVPSLSGGDNEFWVALPLPHQNDLPQGTARVSVAIALEDNEDQLQPVFQCDAALVDGKYVLARDFVKFVPNPNRRIRVSCDGVSIFSKKAKYVAEIGGERRVPWVRFRKIACG